MVRVLLSHKSPQVRSPTQSACMESQTRKHVQFFFGCGQVPPVKQKSLSLVVLTTRGQRVCLQDAGAFGSLGVGFCLLGVGRIAMKLVCHLLQEA